MRGRRIDRDSVNGRRHAPGRGLAMPVQSPVAGRWQAGSGRGLHAAWQAKSDVGTCRSHVSRNLSVMATTSSGLVQIKVCVPSGRTSNRAPLMPDTN
jgi:hypothetical protein